ncbi:hypothetical protein VTJ04DRAFT_2950 [Mycothermus thermophilus]|uniref:uncharacterized protein n=1 Tax=Humicola insolens TaxID=85995 RepID=UPI00374438FF
MSQVDLEILAHVAAPARASDDVKYRGLASAYLNFEPARRIRISPNQEGEPESRVENGLEDAEKSASQRLRQHGTGLESPSMSFQSVDHNLQSPTVRQSKKQAGPGSQLSWQAPSTVNDSMPNNDFVLPEYFTPRRVIEHYNSMLETSPLESPSIPPPGNITAATQGKLHDQTALFDEVDGIPELQSTKKDEQPKHRGINPTPGSDDIIPQSPEQSLKRPASPQPSSPSIIEETRLLPSPSPTQQPQQPSKLTRTNTAPLPSKRRRTSPSPTPTAALSRSASDLWPKGSKPPSTKRGYLPPPPPATLLDSALEIIPPPPPASTRDLRPEDLITDLLARLAQELDLPKRFRPASQARDLRPFERGYWRLDCRAWDAELKRSCWGFLANYLAKGAAGWGTSCRRDEEFKELRVYCWGCTVGHVYLVLYLASRRMVLYTGAEWVGGDGEVVVVMPEKGVAALGN